MTTFEATDGVYSCATECEIWDQPVEHPTVRAFVLAATRLLRSLGEAADSEHWGPYTASLRRCRRLVSTVPLPLDSPVLQLAAEADRLAEGVRRFSHTGDNGVAEQLRGAAAALERLAVDGSDPLGDCARDFLTLDNPRDGILVLPDRRYCDAVAETMARYTVPSRVGTHADLAGLYTYASAVIVGPPSWIRPSVLNAPRARNLALAHYDLFRETPEVERLLYGPSDSTHVTRPIQASKPYRCGPPENPVDPPRPPDDAETELLTAEECSPGEDIRAAFPQFPATGSHQGAIEQVEARPAVLADGSVLLLPTDSDARIISLRPECFPDVQVEQVPASSVGRGDYLVVQDRSHHQDLLHRADAILGADAASLRATQSEWKSRLKKRTEQHPRGIRGVADELRGRGAVTANVGYWISSWCIRPRSRDDFGVVMRYLALSSDIDSSWERLRRIDSAHRSAGQRYAESLQKRLTPDSIALLITDGWCTVRTIGSDRETLVARVDDILRDTLFVPVHELCRLGTMKEPR